MNRQIQLAVKYALDKAVASLALILLLPLGILLSGLIVLDTGWPPLFVQKRVGHGNRLFYIYKFRTMVKDAVQEDLGTPMNENDPRITRVGCWLRIWSLDELPQFVNILKGQMSLIGPRPILFSNQIMQNSVQVDRRHTIRPGMTGWAQVNGRNALSWDKRIELDVWYVNNFSLWLDVWILCKTLRVIFCRKGLY